MSVAIVALTAFLIGRASNRKAPVQVLPNARQLKALRDKWAMERAVLNPRWRH